MATNDPRRLGQAEYRLWAEDHCVHCKQPTVKAAGGQLLHERTLDDRCSYTTELGGTTIPVTVWSAYLSACDDPTCWALDYPDPTERDTITYGA